MSCDLKTMLTTLQLLLCQPHISEKTSLHFQENNGSVSASLIDLKLWLSRRHIRPHQQLRVAIAIARTKSLNIVGLACHSWPKH